MDHEKSARERVGEWVEAVRVEPLGTAFLEATTKRDARARLRDPQRLRSRDACDALIANAIAASVGRLAQWLGTPSGCSRRFVTETCERGRRNLVRR